MPMDDLTTPEESFRLSAEPKGFDKKAYKAAYYQANKEKIKAKTKAYVAANKDRKREQDRAYYAANRDEQNRKNKARYAANRDHYKAYDKARRESVMAYRYARKHGLTTQDLAEMERLQESRCAICRTPFSLFKRRPCVDHCHSTGKVRGLLCHQCNSGLGMIRDDFELLGQALRYLKEHANGC